MQLGARRGGSGSFAGIWSTAASLVGAGPVGVMAFPVFVVIHTRRGPPLTSPGPHGTGGFRRGTETARPLRAVSDPRHLSHVPTRAGTSTASPRRAGPRHLVLVL